MLGGELSGGGNLWGQYPEGMFGPHEGLQIFTSAVMICATLVNTETALTELKMKLGRKML